MPKLRFMCAVLGLCGLVGSGVAFAAETTTVAIDNCNIEDMGRYMAKPGHTFTCSEDELIYSRCLRGESPDTAICDTQSQALYGGDDGDALVIPFTMGETPQTLCFAVSPPSDKGEPENGDGEAGGGDEPVDKEGEKDRDESENSNNASRLEEIMEQIAELSQQMGKLMDEAAGIGVNR